MSTIGAAAACCACSTLAEYEETKATSAAPEKTDEAKQNRKFDWQKNSENLRRLASANQKEVARIKDARQTERKQSDSSDESSRF